MTGEEREREREREKKATRNEEEEVVAQFFGGAPPAQSHPIHLHIPSSLWQVAGASGHRLSCSAMQSTQNAFSQWKQVRCAQGGYCQSQSRQIGSCSTGAVEEAGLETCFPLSLPFPFGGAFAWGPFPASMTRKMMNMVMR